MEDPIYIKHPDGERNENQAEFLASLTDPEQVAEHIYLFNSGNASYLYHTRMDEREKTPELYELWLEGLDEPMRSDFRKGGFERNKGVAPFTRFVNEMNERCWYGRICAEPVE